MTNRRQLLQTGLIALTSLPAWSFASTLAQIENFKGTLPLAVYDDRFKEGIAFGRLSRRQGAEVCAVNTELTDLWVKRLWPAWRNAPTQGVVAGLTGFDVLFCLEMLAHDHAHRVVYRAHHRIAADGKARHEEISKPSHPTLPGEAWAESQAQRLLRGAVLAPQRLDAERCRAAAATASLTRHDLISWVIAPTALIDRSVSA